MSDKLYRLLLIDSDRIFRMGMRSWLAQFLDLEIVFEADTAEDALVFLGSDRREIDLVILDFQLGFTSSEQLLEQLKSQYPKLPILLLSSPQNLELVATTLRSGVEGFCFKGANPEELITAIRQVASGNRYIDQQLDQYLSDRYRLQAKQNKSLVDQPVSVVAIVRQNFYVSGLKRIDKTLNEVKASLRHPNNQISDRLAKMVLEGQARELQAARWLIDQLWGTTKRVQAISPESSVPNIAEEIASPDVEISDRADSNSHQQANILAVQASLWDRTVAKLQANLSNLSKTPLEIDILKDEKKRELFYIALRQIEQSLTELRFSQIQPSQLEEKIPEILKDIWQETVISFFGKYYVINNINNNEYEINIVDTLLKDAEIVQTEFLDKIPQIDNFLSHLLFETELVIDNSKAAVGTPEAMQRVELILDNLIIQIANGVIQPLLNNFANIEEIKQKFYRYNLLATREIERFRNDLSWKYRLEKYITDPQLIFESRQVLWTFADFGIKKISIYSPRSQELQQLEGVQLAVTLALELQDAIAPRLRSAITFIGSGFVYVLTNVIGRGIGLIGRGVVQGIGNAWQDRKSK